MKQWLLLSGALTLLAACSGKQEYIRPTAAAPASNIKVVQRPREQVWNASIAELGKNFFVINNLDKSSGLINISYSGDPEKYIDCGQIFSYVKNMRGERTYRFPAAKAQQSYETMENGSLFGIERRMSLEGRVNLIFEETSKTSTTVTANTKYVITKSSVVRSAAAQLSSQSPATQNFSDSISFNSGGRAQFPQGTECVANGKLEQDILSSVK